MRLSDSISLVFALIRTLVVVYAATKDKPHAHQGTLQPYDGKHMPYQLDAEQVKKLDAGQQVPVMYTLP